MAVDGWPPKFTLQQENILKLLTGDRFYSDPSAALREAILNGIDAINRRTQVEVSLKPDLRVVFDDTHLTLTISDNGIGMNKDDVTSLFAKVGASAAALDKEKKSVGEFGIGVVSYFMAGDVFELFSFNGQDEVVSLSFSKGMLAGSQAKELPAPQMSQGTRVVIRLKNNDVFNLLVSKFPYWCRDVAGLEATRLPENTSVSQGEKAQSIGISIPDAPVWVEKSHIGPLDEPTSWEAMTGHSSISILYRGVFVQEFELQNIWGVRGSIDVDPKRFAPRLNRESFIDGEFHSEIAKYVKLCHPAILDELVEKLVEAKASGTLNKWDENRWANLWLSVPRNEDYKKTVLKWDSIFKDLPAIDIAEGDAWVGISISDLIEKSKGGEIFLAPMKDQGQSDVIKAALRFLRNTGKTVIRGIRKDNSWMRFAPASYVTTSDLIFNHFGDELPPLKNIASEAEKILGDITVDAPLFTGPPKVDLVKVGYDSPPALKVADRLIINIENQAGMDLVNYVLDVNQGHLSLLPITLKVAMNQLSEVGSVLRGAPDQPEIISPVRRRFIREQLI